jgi:hypothetical protein
VSLDAVGYAAGRQAFDKIALAQVRKTAKATGVQPLRDAIMTLLCVELEKILGPSKLPKPPKPAKVKLPPKPRRAETRVAGVEVNVEIGRKLVALRSQIQSNRALWPGRPRAIRYRHHARRRMRARRQGLCRPRRNHRPAVVGLPGQVVVAIDACNGAPGHRGQSDRRREYRRIRHRQGAPGGARQPKAGRSAGEHGGVSPRTRSACWEIPALLRTSSASTY